MSKDLVQRLKFGGARIASNHIARRMNTFVFGRDAVIVHVPTASSRHRARGFDQSELIARRLSYHAALPRLHVLRRLGTSRQVGATRQQRLVQLRGSFVVPRPSRVAGRHIVLVDDVLTTGATLEAAATQLKKAGAKRVEAVVFARA